MKKRKFGYKLSRGMGARKALFRGLVTSLVEHGEIVTTYTKARAVQPEFEKLIKIAKKQTLAARRTLSAKLANDRKTADLLYNDFAKLFSNKNGGYTKIIERGVRKGDGARMVLLKWSIMPQKEVATKKIKKTKATKTKTSRLEKMKKIVGKNRK